MNKSSGELYIHSIILNWTIILNIFSTLIAKCGKLFDCYSQNAVLYFSFFFLFSSLYLLYSFSFRFASLSFFVSRQNCFFFTMLFVVRMFCFVLFRCCCFHFYLFLQINIKIKWNTKGLKIQCARTEKLMISREMKCEQRVNKYLNVFFLFAWLVVWCNISISVERKWSGYKFQQKNEKRAILFLLLILLSGETNKFCY